jgi:hypothetical protein
MARFILSLLSATLLLAGANAQFQFFEQMFNQGGQQHHHQAPQNVPSDSNWYQEHYNNGTAPPMLLPTFSPPNSLPPHISRSLNPTLKS